MPGTALKRVLPAAAIAEAATGAALLIVPSLVGRLLLGEDLAGAAIPVARVAGIALIGLGVACWPGPPLVGMLLYSAGVTLYLAYLGFAVGLSATLLWPAVGLHASLPARFAYGLTGRHLRQRTGDARLFALVSRMYGFRLILVWVGRL